ncbi:MAG: WD40 repeat domain-containing protein [Deltaproteobacteria bacterium]|nr:WD40 repeat domain-containing protein [Deltaproteobacteria bacterium]
MANISNPGQARRIASLDGEFDSAQLTWLASGKLALAVHALAPKHDKFGSGAATVPVSGVYLITEGQPSSIRRLDGITCPLSALAFSPNDALAVAEGGDDAPPAIIDLRHGKCVSYPSAAPLQVVGWAPNSSAFLYRTADQAGVFRFDLHSGRRSSIAISSGAAAYASDGTIIAFGSQELSWNRAVAQPMAPVKAQIALIDPHQNLITINSLGFVTQPVLLAQSTMIWSRASNDGIIDTAIPGPTELVREIIEYSYPTREAFVLAHGPVRGPIAFSWSPDGKQVAIVDGSENHHTLSVIMPPK